MNASTIPFPVAPGPSTTTPHRRRRWIGVLLAFTALALIAVVTLVLSFRPGGEIQELRRAVFATAPGDWDQQFELGIGRLPVLAAKAGLSFVNLAPEARAGLSAFQAADVGIYHRREGSPEPDRIQLLATIRAAMDQAGWEPLAVVHDHHDLVGVFMPKKDSPRSSVLHAAVFVMDGRDLVLVSARANLEALADIAWPTDSLPTTRLAKR